MTAVIDRPTSAPSVAPSMGRPASGHQDPNAWIRGLCGTQVGLALALAVSEMPRADIGRDRALGGYIEPHYPSPYVLGESRRLTPGGVRVVNTWVAQGVERAGGALPLWEAAADLRKINLDCSWNTAQGRALAKRFGGKRRVNTALDMAFYVPTEFDPVALHIWQTEGNDPVIFRLSRLYPLDESAPRRAGVAVFKVRRHDAHMVAASFRRSLAPHPAEGYWLA